MGRASHWRHANTCCHIVPTSQYAVRWVTRVFNQSTDFVSRVSGQSLSSESKQAAAEFYSHYLSRHSRGVIWMIKSKSTIPVSFSLDNAEMNLVTLGNYRTLRGLRTVNPMGCRQLDSLMHICGSRGRWVNYCHSNRDTNPGRYDSLLKL